MKYKILSGSKQFVDEFKRCCNNYSNLRIAVAWCGNPEHVLPYTLLKNFSGKIKITLGISFNHTHPNSIELFKNIGADVHIYTQDIELFHPKVYMFSNKKKIALFVGSSNLTYSGFYKNIEVNSLLEGKPNRQAQVEITNLKKLLAFWHSTACSIKPTNSWLSEYKKNFEKDRKIELKGKIRTPPRSENEVSAASWIKNADWQIFYKKIRENANNNDILRYHKVLDAAVELVPTPWKTNYFRNKEKRKVIGGFGDYGTLGCLFASHNFAKFLKQGNNQKKKQIVQKINAISHMSQPLNWEKLELMLSELLQIGFTMKVWGRLLCLVRPDLFCTVSSINVRKNLSKTLNISQSSIKEPSGYVSLIGLIHSSPWYNSEKPKDEYEARIWARRCAFLDTILY